MGDVLLGNFRGQQQGIGAGGDVKAVHGHYHRVRILAQQGLGENQRLGGKLHPLGRIHDPGQHGGGLSPVERVEAVEGAVLVAAGENAGVVEVQDHRILGYIRQGSDGVDGLQSILRQNGRQEEDKVIARAGTAGVVLELLHGPEGERQLRNGVEYLRVRDLVRLVQDGQTQ